MSKRVRRKRRTREHIIADLGVNYIERFVLLCGFSVERVEKDYGYDLIMFTYDGNGEIENGQVYIQVKAKEQVERLKRTEAVSFALERAHLESWLHEPMPVMLALYDASQDEAYWIYLQAYFETEKRSARGETTQSVHIHQDSVIDVKSVRLWRKHKADILDQLDGVITHNA